MELNTRSYVVNRSARVADIKKLLKTYSPTETTTAKTISVYFIDTSDWQLAQAGYFLQCEYADPTYTISLRKTDTGETLLETVDIQLPRNAANLLPGKLGKQVQNIIAEQPLLPHATIRLTRNRTNLLDDEGKIISKVEFNQASLAAAEQNQDKPVTVKYLDLLPVLGFSGEFNAISALVNDVPDIEPADNPLLLRTLIQQGRFQLKATPTETPVDYRQENWHLLQQMLSRQLTIMQENVPALLKFTGKKQINEFRNAVKCSRSLLANFMELTPVGLQEKIVSFLAETTRQLDPIAAIDSLQENFETYTGDLPGDEYHEAGDFLFHIEETGHARHLDLVRFLESPIFLNIFWDWKRVLNSDTDISTLAEASSKPLKHYFQQSMGQVFNTLVQTLANVDYDITPDQVDKLQRDNSKLLNLMQCYADFVVKKNLQHSLKRIHGLQQSLGTWQSLQLHQNMIQRLRDELDMEGELSADAVATVDTMLDTLSKKLIAARLAFIRQQKKFYDPLFQSRLNRILAS